jgi:hypothetical protein
MNDKITRLADGIDCISKRMDAIASRRDAGAFSRTSPSAFGQLANQVRKQQGDEKAGRTLQVYRIQKNGKPASTPSGYGWPFTMEEAERQVQNLMKLNPNNQYEIR